MRVEFGIQNALPSGHPPLVSTASTPYLWRRAHVPPGAATHADPDADAGALHGGANHLLVHRSTGLAIRSLNLSGQSGVRLRFWAKASGFGASHTAVVQVSSNGVDHTTVRTWTVADSDGVYRYYDFDLSGFAMTSSFSVAFAANMPSTVPKLFIDDIQVLQ